MHRPLILLIAAASIAVFPQIPQVPSPVAETTRVHSRLKEKNITGARRTLSLGTLLAPREGAPCPTLVVHFHGAAWVVEQSVRRADSKAAVLTVQLGAGSRAYAEPFASTPDRFLSLVRESGCGQDRILISAFSAGYGAVREILRSKENVERIAGVLLADGLHAGYEEPEEKRQPRAADLAPFVDFARLAVDGKKRFFITHSEIYPGAYASTTECVDFLFRTLRIRRNAVLLWGPLGMQQLSETSKGKFTVFGFAGNSAPDHIDHLHALSWWLSKID